MQLDHDAYQRGADEAERDIAAGRPRLRYGARGTWKDDLEQTLLSRFNVGLHVLSCCTTVEQSSFDRGYNDAIERHIEEIHGPDSLKAVLIEVQDRRKIRYDSWVREFEAKSSGTHSAIERDLPPNE